MRENFPGGYAGRILRVDLTNERIWTEERPESWYRKWLGGVGFGAAILWDEVPPDVTWDHPDNRLILATGPLAGLSFWGSGGLTVVTRGAMTGGATSTQAQGFFGHNLKYSGYDAIVFQGQAARWVYLFIHDDRVELRDASHLLGRDTWETQDILMAEHGKIGHEMSVYGIGPAGENKVRFAAIAGDYGHVASKNGCGAVMGAKRVKAVAIARGSRALKVPDMAAVWQIANEMAHEHTYDLAANVMYRWGTISGVTQLHMMGGLPVKNYTTSVMPETDRFMREWDAPALRARFPHRGHQCNACGMHHCHQIRVPEGPHKGEIVDEPEYEGFAGCGTTIGSLDPVASAWLNTQVDRAGVDVNEFGWVTGWVMECLEKGYLTPEQVGLDLKWGDCEGANRLLQMIARREGFGDLLAEGVKRACETIGGPAAECGIYTMKGATPRGHDHRALWHEMLDTCLGSTGTLETGWPTRPTELGLPARMNPFDAEEMPRTLATILGRRHFEDSLGMCNFTTKSTLETLSRALSAVTGWDWTFAETKRYGKRVAALLRAFNVRCGIGPETERPGPRYGSTPVDGPAKGISVLPVWDTLQRNFYTACGYDLQTGNPTPELLRQLELEELIPVLWP